MRPLLRRLLSAAVVLAVLVSAATAADEPAFRFARIFTDNMVLQQRKPITIWGWAAPGTTVAVTLTQDRTHGEQAMAKVLELEAQQGIRRTGPPQDEGSYSVTVQYVEKNPPKPITQTADARAGADGRWSVEFKPAAASFQRTWIFANNGADEIAVQDVLIGEIWVCAGQSNMVWSNFNLDELQKDEWLSRNIARHGELAQQVEAIRAAVEAMKARAEKIEE